MNAYIRWQRVANLHSWLVGKKIRFLWYTSHIMLNICGMLAYIYVCHRLIIAFNVINLQKNNWLILTILASYVIIRLLVHTIYRFINRGPNNTITTAFFSAAIVCTIIFATLNTVAYNNQLGNSMMLKALLPLTVLFGCLELVSRMGAKHPRYFSRLFYSWKLLILPHYGYDSFQRRVGGMLKFLNEELIVFFYNIAHNPIFLGYFIVSVFVAYHLAQSSASYEPSLLQASGLIAGLIAIFVSAAIFLSSNKIKYNESRQEKEGAFKREIKKCESKLRSVYSILEDQLTENSKYKFAVAIAASGVWDQDSYIHFKAWYRGTGIKELQGITEYPSVPQYEYDTCIYATGSREWVLKSVVEIANNHQQALSESDRRKVQAMIDSIHSAVTYAPKGYVYIPEEFYGHKLKRAIQYGIFAITAATIAQLGSSNDIWKYDMLPEVNVHFNIYIGMTLILAVAISIYICVKYLTSFTQSFRNYNLSYAYHERFYPQGDSDHSGKYF